MKNMYKILLLIIVLSFGFARTSDKYQAMSRIDIAIVNAFDKKSISKYDDSQNDDSLKWKRRHKRRKKMRRKKRGM